MSRPIREMDPEGRMPALDGSLFDEDEKLRRALDLAYAYVNRRERSVAEVRLRLDGKGIAPELIEAAIRRLTEQGLLDDARFVHMFLADKRELEHWGDDRIRRGLLARGIERDRAEAALSGPAGPDAPAEGELERALALLRRRFPAPLADRRERERAFGVLIRKGYESELALDALNAHARA